MKFLVDAHLPKRLARLLQQLGHDTLHTLDLPDQNRSSDETLNQIAVAEDRIVISKDSDFVDSFLLMRRPGTCCWSLLATLATVNLNAYSSITSHKSWLVLNTMTTLN